MHFLVVLGSSDQHEVSSNEQDGCERKNDASKHMESLVFWWRWAMVTSSVFMILMVLSVRPVSLIRSLMSSSFFSMVSSVSLIIFAIVMFSHLLMMTFHRSERLLNLFSFVIFISFSIFILNVLSIEGHDVKRRRSGGVGSFKASTVRRDGRLNFSSDVVETSFVMMLVVSAVVVSTVVVSSVMRVLLW